MHEVHEFSTSFFEDSKFLGQNFSSKTFKSSENDVENSWISCIFHQIANLKSPGTSEIPLLGETEGRCAQTGQCAPLEWEILVIQFPMFLDLSDLHVEERCMKSMNFQRYNPSVCTF